MRCPACRENIHEGTPACMGCGLTLAALDPHLGIPPQLTAPVADLAGVLSREAKSTLAKAVHLTELHFPDIRGVVITADVPAHFTPELYAFWLFNRTGLFSAMEKGGDNHGVLLLLDTQSARAAVMVGYGLEALIPVSALETTLASATPHLIRQKYAQAGAAFFREFENQLEEASQSWPLTFGYTESAPWIQSATGTLVRAGPATTEDLY